jgi:hypothetical protein
MTNEGRLLNCHLIEDASQRPNVAFSAIRFFLPHLWTGIVGSASLSASHSTGGDNRHIHVCQFHLRLVFGEEDVGTLDIPMQNIHVVQHRETFEGLVGDLPNGVLIDIFPGSLVLLDQLEDIPAFEVFSNDAEGIGELVIEGVLVAEDTGVVDAGQDSNLIEAVGQLFFIEGRDSNLLHGVLETVFFAFDLVDDREGAFSQFGNHCVLVH